MRSENGPKKWYGVKLVDPLGIHIDVFLVNLSSLPITFHLLKLPMSYIMKTRAAKGFPTIKRVDLAILEDRQTVEIKWGIKVRSKSWQYQDTRQWIKKKKKRIKDEEYSIEASSSNYPQKCLLFFFFFFFAIVLNALTMSSEHKSNFLNKLKRRDRQKRTSLCEAMKNNLLKRLSNLSNILLFSLNV